MSDRAAKNSLFDAFAEVAKALGSGRRAEIVDVLAQGERSGRRDRRRDRSERRQHLASPPRADARRPADEPPRGDTRVLTLASERVGELWAALRDVAAEHVAGIEKLTTAYLGDRRDVEAITRDELASRLRRRNVVVIDVRPTAEYAAGHIPGARSVPPDEVRRHLRTIPKDSEIVAYCRGPFCVYADDVVRSLQRRGIRARRLEDGFPEWKRAGHDIAVGEGGGA